jgi:hypothetical protein
MSEANMSMTKSALAGFMALLLSSACVAQFIADDPDWKEVDVPAPPAFDLKRLVPVEISMRSQLKWGVDPTSIQITSDGVVRYVVVAQSTSGVVNAMYEGIRCNKGEFRLYARHNPGSGWVNATKSDWTSLRQSGTSSHQQALAKQGMCDGAAPPSSVKEAIRRLSITERPLN